jgi:hypothetical protein
MEKRNNMSMNLTPNDIDIIENGGMLDGQDVKLVRTRGGFWMAVAKNKVLTGGSHPAIVKYTISKMYPSFQPAMCKSQEYGADALVEKHSHFLSDALRKSGHDIYSVQQGNDVEFHITKNNFKISSLAATLNEDALNVNELKFPKEFVEAVSGAATEKALSCQAKKINIWKK